MITLHQFVTPPNHASFSPFCFKLETYLRLAGVPYTSERGTDPSVGPKGKMPFIDDGGQRIGDSALIIDHLRTAHGVDLDAGLTAAQRALAHAVSVMLEEHLYFALVWARWLDDAVWPTTKQLYFGQLPPHLFEKVPEGARAGVRLRLESQGMGRHTPDEIVAFAAQDIAALAELLGEGPYLFGAQPCSADATILAFVASMLFDSLPTRLTPLAKAQPKLVAYRDRMMGSFYADLAA
jgi:glutathione S-transferase